MKHFLLALFLLPLTLFAQPDDASWLNVTVQTDNYGGESSWEIINSDNNTVAVSPPLANNTLTNIMVFLPAGDYAFIMYDSFGDGICCSFGQGFFGITNSLGAQPGKAIADAMPKCPNLRRGLVWNSKPFARICTQ